MNADLQELLTKIDITFTDQELLTTAFVHRSYLNEKGKHLSSNERLEFLGDAILSFIISDYLYRTFPDHPEGKLTNIRSSIVKTSTLAHFAQELDFGKYLLLSHGEEEGGGRTNQSLLADTFEAFLGALFLDQGLGGVKTFLDKILIPQIPQLLQTELNSDYKSKLQEYVQTFSKIAPTYKVVKSSGPDHAKTFWVAVVIDGVEQEIGSGKSKQEAEQMSAAKTLEKLKVM